MKIIIHEPTEIRTIETTMTVEEVLNEKECPLPLDVITDRMGINLCSVESVTWSKQDDGQLFRVAITFIPDAVTGKEHHESERHADE